MIPTSFTALDTIPLKKWKVKLWELKPDQTKRK
jgi:hypothetical protein